MAFRPTTDCSRERRQCTRKRHDQLRPLECCSLSARRRSRRRPPEVLDVERGQLLLESPGKLRLLLRVAIRKPATRSRTSSTPRPRTIEHCAKLTVLKRPHKTRQGRIRITAAPGEVRVSGGPRSRPRSGGAKPGLRADAERIVEHRPVHTDGRPEPSRDSVSRRPAAETRTQPVSSGRLAKASRPPAAGDTQHSAQPETRHLNQACSSGRP